MRSHRHVHITRETCHKLSPEQSNAEFFARVEEAYGGCGKAILCAALMTAVLAFLCYAMPVLNCAAVRAAELQTTLLLLISCTRSAVCALARGVVHMSTIRVLLHCNAEKSTTHTHKEKKRKEKAM